MLQVAQYCMKYVFLRQIFMPKVRRPNFHTLLNFLKRFKTLFISIDFVLFFFIQGQSCPWVVPLGTSHFNFFETIEL
jgi:hypothetical protein